MRPCTQASTQILHYTHTHTSMRVFLEFLRRRHVLASAAKCMRMSRMHARYLHTTGARAMSPCCRQAFNILLFVSAGAHAVCCRPPRDGFAVLSVRQYIYTIYVHTIYREIEIEIEIDRFRYLNHCRPASAYVSMRQHPTHIERSYLGSSELSCARSRGFSLYLQPSRAAALA